MGFSTQSGELGPLQELAEMMLSTLAADQTLDQLDIDPFAQMERAVAIARANPVVQVPGNFVQLGRVFGAVGGYLVRYQPRLNLMALVAPYFSKALMP
jgi:predicted unusual protein kinase regulating ubiquinone biosynthesis (AarF/ABC1/UbiB family)